MAPPSKRTRFIDDEAEVDEGDVRESSDEEEDSGFDGFFNDNEEEVPHSLPRSRTSFGVNDQEDGEDIEEYVKTLKRRAQESSCIEGSSTEDRHPELWMLPVPAGMETILTTSLLQITEKTHGHSGIKIHHVPFLPRRIYIEAPGIAEIQEFMKFSAYGHLVSRATRVLDDIDRNFLHSTPDVPCTGSWVRITQPGIYKGDLALVHVTPSMGDIITVLVVPRFTGSQNKKRKGNARPAPALLDPKFVATFPFMRLKGIHLIGSRWFHANGLEFLDVASAHALKIEPRPSEAELLLFQSSIGILNKTFALDHDIQRAVKKAFCNESRRLWRRGDRIRILEGVFMDKCCSIHEIDEVNQSVIVEFNSPELTRVEVCLEDLERLFLVGDQVRVALGENKGRTGSIVIINDGVGTIVEGTANQVLEFQSPLLYLESHDLPLSFATTPHPAASSMSMPKPSHQYEAPKGHHQMPGGRDPRIGREAAVYVGPMKGYQGRLRDIGGNFGKIECPGRQVPIYTASLNQLVLLDTPTHNLAGTKLNRPYVGRDLTRPEPPLPRTSTPPPLPDEHELTLEERGGAPTELGSGAFLRDPEISTNIEGFHVWVGFHITYQNGSHTTRHAYTPLSDKFADANGQCAHHEVCIILTDHRTAIPVQRRVELYHLKPVPPKKKGDWIVIISGDHKGVVTEVIACKTKASKAEVSINGAKISLDFSDVCRLTKPQ